MAERGSRGGIVAALVVFVILFFVAGVFAVVKATDANKYQKALNDLTTRYNAAVSSADLASSEFTQLKGPGGTAWDNLLRQRNEAVRLIIGRDPATANAGEEATKAFASYIEDANKRLADAKVTATIPSGSVKDAIGAMAQAVAQKGQDVNNLTAQLTAANENLKKEADNYGAAVAELRTKLEQANAGSSKAMDEAKAYREQKDAQLAQIEKQLVAAIETGRQATEELNKQLAGRNEQITKLTKQLGEAVTQLTAYRPNNVAESVIRRADARIIRVDRTGPANDARSYVVYVDLGTGAQLTPGMTFQVYDRNEGIPRTDDGTGNDQLPPGKASLEIVRVGGTSSEARVIKLNPGVTLQEGDLAANLIYDPNVKLAFKIFGNFDIDQNGVATPGEADVLKRLVTGWGGNVTDQVNVATDFVVLGKEITLPEKPSDDNPIEVFNYNKLVQAKEEYEAIRDRALELHIPVLNQNRFLYLIGFYDQARK